MTWKDLAGGAFSGLLLAAVAAWFVRWQFVALQQIEPFGSVLFGAVLGWVMRFYINRMDTFSVKELGSLVAILVGGTMVALFGKGSSKDLLFFYMSGLGFGFFGAQVWNLFVGSATDDSVS